jgi:hypothetical protein
MHASAEEEEAKQQGNPGLLIKWTKEQLGDEQDVHTVVDETIWSERGGATLKTNVCLAHRLAEEFFSQRLFFGLRCFGAEFHTQAKSQPP